MAYLKTTVIKVDGSCDYKGHGGWGVVICNGEIHNYSGHILTNEPLTAEKMAIAMGLILAPTNQRVRLLSDCQTAVSAFYFPKAGDVFDEEIAELRKSHPLVEVVRVPRREVSEADRLARAGTRSRGR